METGHQVRMHIRNLLENSRRVKRDTYFNTVQCILSDHCIIVILHIIQSRLPQISGSNHFHQCTTLTPVISICICSAFPEVRASSTSTFLRALHLMPFIHISDFTLSSSNFTSSSSFIIEHQINNLQFKWPNNRLHIRNVSQLHLHILRSWQITQIMTTVNLLSKCIVTNHDLCDCSEIFLISCVAKKVHLFIFQITLVKN